MREIVTAKRIPCGARKLGFALQGRPSPRSLPRSSPCHATLMLSKGVHPKIVSEHLGHASIGITLDTYSHVLPAMQQEAADAFDELFAQTST